MGWCYWETIEEHNENFEEQFENPLGSWCEHIGNYKNPKNPTLSTLSIPPKEKKTLGPLGVHGGTPHWLAKNFYAYLYCLKYLT